jgi:hypothetical protein
MVELETQLLLSFSNLLASFSGKFYNDRASS